MSAMKINVLFLLVTACCMALTCSSASIRSGPEQDEQTGPVMEQVLSHEQILHEWSHIQDIEKYARENFFSAHTMAGIDAETSPTVKLPASLRIVEDEAFEGTAIVQVELPETVESIGERSFANILTLRRVKIPERTMQIARTAFSGSNRLTITGTPGSYARTWARENGVLFTPILVVHAGNVNVQIAGGANHRKEQIDVELTRSGERMEEHARWRPVSEITADQYEDFIANHLSGRAPPASV